MKAKRAFAVLAALHLGAVSLAAQALATGLSVARLEDGVYVVTHAYPWPSNSLVAAMRDGRLLMIDTPYTPEATEAVLGWARQEFGDREIVAITTHFHVDRLGGNAALARRGIPIYGSELTLAAIAERGSSSLRGLAGMVDDPRIRAYFRSFQYVAPTRVFDPELGPDLDFGGERVYVEYPGTGHSVDNLVVYLPDKSLIFGGCMILSQEAKGVGATADGDPAEWLESLARIRTEGYGLVVPGHGRPGGIELVAHTAKLLAISPR